MGRVKGDSKPLFLETLRIERVYKDSGKWKTEGCLCGAGPGKIEPFRHAYTDLEHGVLRVITPYRCVVCKEEYNLIRIVDGKEV